MNTTSPSSKIALPPASRANLGAIATESSDLEQAGHDEALTQSGTSAPRGRHVEIDLIRLAVWSSFFVLVLGIWFALVIWGVIALT